GAGNLPRHPVNGARGRPARWKGPDVMCNSDHARRRRSSKRAGAVAAEFAFLLPVLMLIVLICVDFARFAYTYIALKNAAQAGTSYAIMTPYLSSTQAAWETQIQTKARNEMTGQTSYDSTKLTTSTSVTVESSGLHRVRVTASYDSFKPIVA